jgi:toxin ParE1/3/4
VSRIWTLRLSGAAEADYRHILHYTAERFGQRQSDEYATLLQEALAALLTGPDVIGSLARDEIQPGLRSLHISRRGRRGRHLIFYRAADDIIVVLRILHDSMDLSGNIPPESP